MKTLIDIIGDSKILSIRGEQDVVVTGLQIDSRKVEKGNLYAALKGYTVDGHSYIESAIDKGATAILCEVMPAELHEHVTYIQVADSRKELGVIADAYYDHPSSQLKLVGVTGTNGKTTIATLLYDLYTRMGYKVGLVSTVENKIGDKVLDATHTTPDVVSLQALLSDMVESGCTYAFMEVSSHAVDQQRIAGVTFMGGLFTNLSHDHLDYHETFDKYLAAKKAFFDQLGKEAFSLTNLDDRRGEVMLQNSKSRRKSYALKTAADYKGKIVSNTIEGLQLDVNGHEVHFRLVGAFNASNLLAVYGAARELGDPAEEVLMHLSVLAGAEGRFEKVVDGNSSRVGIVDYAHTPDALANVLETINQVKRQDAQIITVVGCGGDRDKTKRPKMAKVSAMLSSKVILTNDNPRTEDPETILDEMEAGLTKDQKKNVLRLSNRKEAIKAAVMLAKDGDIILVAGKGHEKYQDINGVKHPFDDKRVLKAAMLEST